MHVQSVWTETPSPTQGIKLYQWSGFGYCIICDFYLGLCGVSRGCMHAVLCVYLNQCQHYHLSRPMCTVLLPSIFLLPWQQAALLQYIIIHNNTHKHTHSYTHTHTHSYTHTCTHSHMHACMHAHTHTLVHTCHSGASSYFFALLCAFHMVHLI